VKNTKLGTKVSIFRKLGRLKGRLDRETDNGEKEKPKKGHVAVLVGVEKKMRIVYAQRSQVSPRLK